MDPYNTADAVAAPLAPPVTASRFDAPATSANPYAAPSTRLADAREEGELVLASRMSRLGAALIDGAVIAVPAILLAIAMPSLFEPGAPMGRLTTLLVFFGVGALAFVIYQLVMLYRHGQTLGKKLVGIRIVRSDGSRAGFGRMFGLRYFVPGLIGSIPVVGPIFSLVDILFIFGQEKRCLHDMIADTVVVDV